MQRAAGDSATLGGKYGGVLRVALRGVPGPISPLASNDADTGKIVDLVYDSLARVDSTSLAVIPWVADSWNITNETWMNVTVFVKNYVKWHDGSALTLRDIKWTYNLSGYAPSYITEMLLNETANTITFCMQNPNGSFLVDGLQLKLVPYGFGNGSAPKGCGPYKFRANATGYVELETFEDYFKGRAYLDGINFTYYNQPTNRTEFAMVDLMNDTLDTIGWNLDPLEASQNVLVNGNATNLKAHNNTAEVTPPSLRQLVLGLNCGQGMYLSELAVRRAIAYATDKDALWKFNQGDTLVAKTVIPSEDFTWFNSTTASIPLDTTMANDILNQAGYYDVNFDGYRELPNGTKFFMRFLAPTSEENLQIYGFADIIQKGLDKIGLNVTLVFDTPANRTAMVNADNYDLFIGFEERLTVKPLSLFPMFYSPDIAAGSNLYNFKGAANVTNVTVRTDSATSTGMLAHTNIVGTKPIVAWRNGVLWGSAVNQTIMAYNGTDYVLLRNVSIASASVSFYKWAGGLSTLVPTTNFTLNLGTGNVSFSAGYLQAGDIVTAFYNYTTYQMLDLIAGKIQILNNFDIQNDTLTMSYSYIAFDDAVQKVWRDNSTAAVVAHYKEAQGAVADLVPVVPLLTYKFVNSYDRRVYTGWVEMLDGIHNFWSFIRVHAIMTDAALIFSASAFPGYATSGGTLSVKMRLDDENGAAVSGAHISFTPSDGFSNITDNGDGTYTATFTAPEVSEAETITTTVHAAKRSYEPVDVSMPITVHPVQCYFAIEVKFDNSTAASDTLMGVTVTVRDDTNRSLITNANVTLTISPSGVGATLDNITGVTNSAGQFKAKVNVSKVTVDTYFRVTASVSKAGYLSDSGTATLFVPKYGGEQPNNGILGLSGPSPLMVISVLGLVAVAMALARRRRR
ncbi:MAG: hypothetical protein HZB92_04355 [Euryarchaeota archaeon]|nr:hypothetical protein [Euryarchaeota archaeon]